MEKGTLSMLGAVAAAPLVYLLPLYMGNIWMGYFLLLCVAVLFLLSLIKFGSENLESKAYKRIFIGLTASLLVVNVLQFTHDYSRKDFQKGVLLDIRKTIDEGITKSDVQKELTYIFSRYHTNDRKSVLKTARDVIPEKLGDNGIYISDFDLKQDSLHDDNANFFYEMDEQADELRVIVVTDVARGQNPEYENYDGQTGRFEMEFTVNKEGVHYEVRN